MPAAIDAGSMPAINLEPCGAGMSGFGMAGKRSPTVATGKMQQGHPREKRSAVRSETRGNRGANRLEQVKSRNERPAADRQRDLAVDGGECFEVHGPFRDELGVDKPWVYWSSRGIRPPGSRQ